MSERRVVLVTGAAQRIGACIAETFHGAGFSVILHYRHSGTAAAMLVAGMNQRRPESAVSLQADLTDAAQVQQLATTALAHFGSIDVLVNNASSYYPTTMGSIEHTHWDDLVDSNLRYAFFLCQAFAPELTERRGTIVNLVDTHIDRPLVGYSIYSIAKAGLKAMTRSLAAELAPRVRVNGVAPGAILWPAALENSKEESVLKSQQAILGQIPLGHLGTPQQIADTVFFLATVASYVTGQVVRVDGGRYLNL